MTPVSVEVLERRLSRAQHCLKKAIKEDRVLDAFQQQRRIRKAFKRIQEARDSARVTL